MEVVTTHLAAHTAAHTAARTAAHLYNNNKRQESTLTHTDTRLRAYTHTRTGLRQRSPDAAPSAAHILQHCYYLPGNSVRLDESIYRRPWAPIMRSWEAGDVAKKALFVAKSCKKIWRETKKGLHLRRQWGKFLPMTA